MTETGSPQRHYWQRHTDGEGRWRIGREGPPGAELAALRRGIGREAGSVPELWPFYTTLTEDGRIRDALRAEHVALTHFAVYQQSRPWPAHRHGVGFGSAMRALRDSGQFSVDAVDRRFAAAATAASLAELEAHLRGLVTQLRAVKPGPGLDFTSLFRDLCDWQRLDRGPAVRRRWGSQYFVRRVDTADTGTDEAVASPNSAESSPAS
ncbi:MAG: type I-E CRISPR-associated protein Cse2/CasB [Sporichthyaceae bacterium]|nr:type I-E CRISPR-associated protein Cse2/CasB [Sporichthyaceae bacterium]